MTRRIVPLGTALTLAHMLAAICWAGAYLGVARATRESGRRDNPVLQTVVTAGDVLMFPTSVAWWVSRGQRFPWSMGGLLLTSPMWGFAIAYATQRRART